MVQSIFNPVLGRIRQLIGNQVRLVKEKEGKNPKVRSGSCPITPILIFCST